MSKTRVCHRSPPARKPQSQASPGLSDAEVQRLLARVLGDKPIVAEEVLAVVAWGHLMRQGAHLLEQALAGRVRLVVENGVVIEAWPVGQGAPR